MSIHPDLQRLFSERQIKRGHELVSQDRMLEVGQDSSHLMLLCQDRTEMRMVTLRSERSTLSFACSCPEFEERQSCPHLWAGLLVAAESGWSLPDETASVGGRPRSSQPHSQWRRALTELRMRKQAEIAERWKPIELGQAEVLYVVLPMPESGEGVIRVDTRRRERTAPDRWGAPALLRVEDFVESGPRDGEDGAILDRLRAIADRDRLTQRYWNPVGRLHTFDLGVPETEELLPRMAATGRLYWSQVDDDWRIDLDHGSPWELRVGLVDDADGEHFSLTGELVRGCGGADEAESDAAGESREPETRELENRDLENRDLEEVLIFLPSLVLLDARVHRFDGEGVFDWVRSLLDGRLESIPQAHRAEVIRELLSLEPAPRLELGEEWSRRVGSPRGRAVIRKESAPTGGRQRPRLVCDLFFDYGDGIVLEAEERSAVAVWVDERSVVVRDFNAEQRLVRELLEAGARRARRDSTLTDLTVTRAGLPALVDRLGRNGWAVEAEGTIYRSGGRFQMSVSSGIDWFEVEGGVDFDEEHVPFARLLGQLKRGTHLVRLGDGSMGVLPEEWMRRAGLLLTLGRAKGDAVRYGENQAFLLDALLATQERVTTDARFDEFRERLRSFEGVEPRRERRSFKGILRAYQREGLGWLEFLREFGLGGCLADDMGLGKTVQVLALFEELRVSKKARGPHLVVAPRSVVGNWCREAARFTPKLTVIDYSGADRLDRLAQLADADLAVTTYGILRRDVVELRELEFDVVVLDEAQAIKNAASQTAKSARLLTARQRLALSGTPIENHLGELWSLFEFLNPGMLGSASAFQRLLAGARGEKNGAESASGSAGGDTRTEDPAGAPPAGLDPQGFELLTRAVRPFVLRRTKELVLTDLPEKVEQTLYCDMAPKQRRLYDELKEHYRASLLAATQKKGIGRAKLQILEALLRLRQAACHPGLLDSDRRGDPSVKLDVLLEQLREVVGEGHKALVFSQFTQFLALVRKTLDDEGIVYEYLDGRTRDRDARIGRFQSESGPPVFLISLKAGGLGLNLTAADYAFILDPWWNPAVEAQAIDRAHRIGQTKRVFAYRLIAKDTVEEKILELQKDKRELAESIIRADEGLLRTMTREDLEVLLG